VPHREANPYLGLLNLRNTHQEGLEASPAQKHFTHRWQTYLFVERPLFLPCCSNSVK